MRETEWKAHYFKATHVPSFNWNWPWSKRGKVYNGTVIIISLTIIICNQIFIWFFDRHEALKLNLYLNIDTLDFLTRFTTRTGNIPSR